LSFNGLGKKGIIVRHRAGFQNPVCPGSGRLPLVKRLDFVGAGLEK